ncbi:DNA methyltransferase, partial [Thermococcus sp.]|uniref:DNA methyltransferase n=1 Tax=Thermococcus sp. TaxID=35749 RepID=UPI0026267E2F
MVLTHKIICGDCIEVMKEMESDSVDLVVTSPPYPGNNKMWGDMFNEKNIKKAHNFLSRVWDECIRLLKPGCKLIINIANTKRRPYIPNTHYIYSSIENKIEPLGEIIWNKGYGQIGTAWGSF